MTRFKFKNLPVCSSVYTPTYIHTFARTHIHTHTTYTHILRSKLKVKLKPQKEKTICVDDKSLAS